MQSKCKIGQSQKLISSEAYLFMLPSILIKYNYDQIEPLRQQLNHTLSKPALLQNDPINEIA